MKLQEEINTHTNNKELFNKENFIFTRINKNDFELVFTMENNNIFLSQIIDFGLIQLIHKINTDIYEKTHIQNISNDEINLSFLLKHFFKDVGFSQKFSFVNVKKIVEDDKITFFTKTIYDELPKQEMPINSELLPIENMTSICNIITPHKINFLIKLKFRDTLYLPEFVEKMFGVIAYKIFKRLKQFIENINNNSICSNN